MADQMKVRVLLIRGLVEDGGHHKQYYLEQILKELFGEEQYNRMKKEYDWEPGIA